MHNRKKLKTELTILLSVIIIFVILYSLGLSWFCPLFDGIGVPCPFCGLTSSFFAFLELDFSRSYYHHPLLLLIPIFVLVYGYNNYFKKGDSKYYGYFIYFLITIFLLTYILRLNGLIPNSAKLVMNHDSLFSKVIEWINNYLIIMF